MTGSEAWGLPFHEIVSPPGPREPPPVKTNGEERSSQVQEAHRDSGSQALAGTGSSPRREGTSSPRPHSLR